MQKKLLIIGASSAIGLETINQLKGEGYQFLLHYNNHPIKLSELDVREDQILGVFQGDLSTSEGIEYFLESIPFSVDEILFCQGIPYYQLLSETDSSIMDSLYHIHVKSTMMISKRFLPDMIQQQRGAIIVVSSIWGEVGASNEVVYSTMKGAQISFVKSLAKEVGPSNIKVNAVSPGMIETSMNKVFSVEDVNDWLDTVPIQRVGYPEDVAKAIRFLLSDRSSYIQGHTLQVNGGKY
ncbi:3-ketoacyl-ACP reductase [Halalkalibacillus sediminis]|uniref:3-ketoacyl-ACP reductase n=1 Tax=Halalkalibacillus sediminis TaxID=2018042 RepID=A0A2I0QYG3_9BACI|nr:3-ketoacyl-ACP reductase [Halalkalibacillus sediminis]